MKFKFYRNASKCGLDSPTLLTTVLVNNLTFIIAVLQPNVRTKRRKTNSRRQIGRLVVTRVDEELKPPDYV